jgi:hypothetical protein
MDIQIDSPITEGYHVKYYTKEIMPFSPTIRHERVFTSKEGAETFMSTIITEKGLPNPTCNSIYTIILKGELYAVTKIPSYLIG